ncbi:MAG: lysophospholipid acyltransferase family protein [bacterium]
MMLVTIRSVIYFVAMLLTVLFFGLALGLLGWLLPLSWRDALGNGWGHSNMWLLKVICGLRYEVKGLENVTADPVIVMAKHQSTWETMSLRGLFPRHQSWIAKQELAKIPVFGWALKAVPSIPIDRKAGRKAVKQIIDEGTRLLNMGRIIMIFPEGTRTAPGTRGRYGIGGGLLAEKSGYPVIPLAHNAGVFWKRRGLKKYPGTIQVVIGEPINTEGKKASVIMREVEAWIEDQMDKLPQTVEG